MQTLSAYFSRETRNISLVRLTQIYEAKQEMQTNVTNIAATCTKVSTYSARRYFKINVKMV